MSYCIFVSSTDIPRKKDRGGVTHYGIGGFLAIHQYVSSVQNIKYLFVLYAPSF